jgi:hypothetical protein
VSESIKDLLLSRSEIGMWNMTRFINDSPISNCWERQNSLTQHQPGNTGSFLPVPCLQIITVSRGGQGTWGRTDRHVSHLSHQSVSSEWIFANHWTPVSSIQNQMKHYDFLGGRNFNIVVLHV